MSLIDFVMDAGKKLFGREEEAAPAAASAPPMTVDPATVSRRRAAALAKMVSDLGLPVDDLSVKVEGDVATVAGTAKSQEVREKIVLAVGNVNGIRQVDDRLQVATREPEAVFYTVQRGDTLSKIAKTQYGNAMKYPVIFEANKPMLTDPDKIYPGQVLRIPPLAG